MRLLTTILILAYAAVALAVPVEPAAENGVAAMMPNWNANMTVLCTTGDVFMYNYNTGAWDPTYYNSPVPVSEIADWQITALRTHSGDLWTMDNYNAPWVLVAPPCEGPIQSESETLGSIKQMFR